MRVSKLWLYHVILISMVFLLFSCSAKVNVNLETISNISTDSGSSDPPSLSGWLNVDIVMKDFLYNYLEDLLGFQNQQEFIHILGIKKYLNQFDSIQDATVEAVDADDGHALSIQFKTNNLARSLDDLEIPYENQRQNKSHVLKVYVTKEFFEILFSQVQQLQDIDFATIILPEEDTISDDYVDQIAWAFSDYAEPWIIEKDINNSSLGFDISINTNANKKSKRFGIIPILYTKVNAIEIQY